MHKDIIGKLTVVGSYNHGLNTGGIALLVSDATVTAFHQSLNRGVVEVNEETKEETFSPIPVSKDGALLLTILTKEGEKSLVWGDTNAINIAHQDEGQMAFFNKLLVLAESGQGFHLNITSATPVVIKRKRKPASKKLPPILPDGSF